MLLLFLNKENKFHAANFSILDLKFTSSSIMEEWWEIIAFVKLQHKKFSIQSKFLTSKIDIKKLGSNILFFLHWATSKLDVQHGGRLFWVGG